MIKSMTGYGRGEASGRFGTIKVEIKSLNNKFFDLGAKLPNGLAIFEDRIREYVQKSIKRGRVNLSIAHEHGGEGSRRITLNMRLASSLLREIKRFQRSEGLKGPIDLNAIIAFPGVLGCADTAVDARRLWSSIRRALDEALRNLDRTRCREGRILAQEMRSRARKIRRYIEATKKRSNKSIAHYKNEFARRVKELSGGIEIDKARLAQEVAIYAKNCDVTEEITRIRSHTENFEKSLRADGEKGKVLDFIAQELMREANTIGSKSSDFQISNYVIKIKSEIEKIREQVKNIE